MADARNRNRLGIVGNFIHDPVITDAHAIPACCGEFLHTDRARLGTEISDGLKNATTQRGWQCIDIFLGT